MAFGFDASSKESWMQQFESGYKSLVESWQSASVIIQEQVSTFDLMNPTCSCDRMSDNAQLVLPVVPSYDERAYPVGDETAGKSSPFSPRRAASNAMPSSNIASTRTINEASSLNREGTFRSVTAEEDVNMDIVADLPPPSKSKPRDHIIVDPAAAERFAYYAESQQILRPPSSVAASTVSTAVRAAPWDQFMKQDKPKPGKAQECQTGSSLVSKGAASTSQAATALQTAVTAPPASAAALTTPSAADRLPAVPVDERSPAVCSTAYTKPTLNQEQTSTVQGISQSSHIPAYPVPESSQKSTVTALTSATKIEERPLPMQPLSHQAAPAKPDTRAPAPVQAPPQAPPQNVASVKAVDVPKVQPTEFKESPKPATSSASTAPAVVSAAQPREAPKPEPKPADADAAAVKAPDARAKKAIRDDRKSALSTSIPMTSSAAAALGGLSMATSKKRSGSVERGSTQSVIGGGTVAPRKPAALQVERTIAEEPEQLPAAAKKVEQEALPTASKNENDEEMDKPKPIRPSAKQRSARSKGPDAKSVISGLNNSSSSASALLGPMMQGTKKKKPARPAGADVASVI